MTRRVLLFLLAACFAGAFAWSNPQDESYTRIARLSYVEGHVSFQHSSDVDWSAASINLPIEPGDRIYTGTDGRAEIEFDDGSVFRMAEGTDVEFLSMRPELVQARMLLGLATLNVLGDTDFEIDTPAAAFNTLREGIYRFDVVENGTTDGIVRKGLLEAANNNFSRRLRAGDLLHISPGDANPTLSAYDRSDAWDEWNDRRNADLQVYGNQRYLPDNVYIGASELYRYGRWVNVESYGTGWIPYAVDAEWSPYSIGRWCYRPLYGWTWISYEPWGWLPFHYGRWYRSSLYGWCWLPGPSFGFNFWSPGLVTFYYGPSWISWCPLGPGDYYDVRNYHYNHGIYSHQLAELRRLNTRGVGDPFNQHVQGAFRTASLERFREGSFDARTRDTRWGNIDRPWSQGTLVRDRLTIKPGVKSYSAVTDRIAVRPSSSDNRPVVVRSVPERNSDNRARFDRITNPQIPSIQPRSVRAREGEGGTGDRSVARPNARVIQAPGNRSESGPANQADRVERQRWPGSRSNNEENIRSGSTRTSPSTAEPANRQNPPRQRNERTVPEKRVVPQRSPEASPQRTPETNPRNEGRQESSYMQRAPETNPRTEQRVVPQRSPEASPQRAPETNTRNESRQESSYMQRAPATNPRTEPRRQGGYAQRWDNSNSATNGFAEPRGARVYTVPESNGGGRWYRPAEPQRTPSYNAPSSSSSSERWGNSRNVRTPEFNSSRSLSAPAARPSAPAGGGFRRAPSASASRGSSGGESRRSSGGNSGRRR
jgi:hypothetical protein